MLLLAGTAITLVSTTYQPGVISRPLDWKMTVIYGFPCLNLAFEGGKD